MNRERSSKIHLKMWMLYPLTFVVGMFVFYNQPTSVLQYTPRLPFLSTSSHISHHVPTMPTKLYDVYKLGQLSQQRANTTLHEASVMVKYNLTKFEDFDNITEILRDYETTHAGFVNRVWGLVSFVNAILLLSGIGLVLLTMPCLSTILEPLAKLIGEIFFNIVVPMLEPISYVVTFYLIVCGANYTAETGFYITFVGALLFGIALLYSGIHHEENPYEHVDLKRCMFSFVLSLVWAPVALHYHSSLFGFLTVTALYTALGFSVCCYGLCWCIGFKDHHMMERCTVSSVLLIAGGVFLRSVTHIQPFLYGIYIYGAMVYFLAVLILASEHYYWRESETKYGAMQFLMIISVLVAFYVGTAYNITSLYYVAMVYALFYIGEKISEWKGWRGIEAIGAFLACLAVFLSALWLSAHPEVYRAIIYFTMN
jgi:hypothetical protein